MAESNKRNANEDAERSQNGQEGSKRQRTAHACDSCRGRKSRRDGRRPACHTCVSMGFDCYYRRSSTRQSPPERSDQVSHLEGRLLAMERMLQAAIGAGTVKEAMIMQTISSPNTESGHATAPDGSATFQKNGSDIRARSATIPRDLETPNNSVDEMASNTFQDEEVHVYFGTFAFSSYS
jgi:hypothetical protein